MLAALKFTDPSVLQVVNVRQEDIQTKYISALQSDSDDVIGSDEDSIE